MMLYNFGPLVIQSIPVIPETPIFHTSSLGEISEPYRSGTCLIIRYWRGRGLLIGWWTARHADEDSALLAAIGGRTDDLLDEDGHLQERFHSEPEFREDDDWQIVEVHEASEVFK